MPSETLEIQNLLLASLLITAGARLDQIESGDRLSTIHLDTRALRKDRLIAELKGLIRELDGLNSPSAEDWGWLFDSSFLGTMDAEYRRLKRLVVTRRGRT